MTKVNIKKVIDESNTNKDIKWSVTKNTQSQIILRNSYDPAVKYSINICNEEHGDDAIIVKNEHLGSTVTCLIQGNDRWSDYLVTDDGITMAIKAAVKNFNTTY